MLVVVTSKDNYLLNFFLSSPGLKGHQILVVWDSESDIILEGDFFRRCEFSESVNFPKEIFSESVFFLESDFSRKMPIVKMPIVVNSAKERFQIGPNLQRQTTFRKCLLYWWLFEQGITEFFFSDDDVYIRSLPIFERTTLTYDKLLSNKVCNNWFSLHFRGFNVLRPKDVLFFVGNFYLKYDKDDVDFYTLRMEKFIQYFNKARFEVETRPRGGNIFFTDSFFLNNIFVLRKEFFDVSDFVSILFSKILATKMEFTKSVIHFNVIDKVSLIEDFKKRKMLTF